MRGLTALLVGLAAGVDADRANYALGGSCAAPTGLRGSSSPRPGAHARWGTFANFAFTPRPGPTSGASCLWRYGTGVLGADDPNTPDNESGRWEVNAQFDGNSLFADTCHPGSTGRPAAIAPKTLAASPSLRLASVSLISLHRSSGPNQADRCFKREHHSRSPRAIEAEASSRLASPSTGNFASVEPPTRMPRGAVVRSPR